MTSRVALPGDRALRHLLLRRALLAGFGAVHVAIERAERMVQLGMGRHDVIALHEGLHRQLPVRRQDGGIAPLHAQLVGIMRFKPVDQRTDAVADRRSVVVEVDPGRADRGLDAAGDEVDIVRIELALAEQLLAVHERVLAVHVEAPAVERADEARRPAVAVIVALAARDRHAAVAAGVVIRLDPAFARVDDDHRLADVLVLDPVARLGDLLEPAGHLPDVRPQVVELGLVEFRIIIAFHRDPLRIADRIRHGPKATVC